MSDIKQRRNSDQSRLVAIAHDQTHLLHNTSLQTICRLDSSSSCLQSLLLSVFGKGESKLNLVSQLLESYRALPRVQSASESNPLEPYPSSHVIRRAIAWPIDDTHIRARIRAIRTRTLQDGFGLMTRHINPLAMDSAIMSRSNRFVHYLQSKTLSFYLGHGRGNNSDA